MSEEINRDNILRLHETIKNLILRVEGLETELKTTRTEVQHSLQVNTENYQKCVIMMATNRGSGATG
jgi:archaellum component FlaC